VFGGVLNLITGKTFIFPSQLFRMTRKNKALGVAGGKLPLIYSQLETAFNLGSDSVLNELQFI
jgi:hypothetical protein